MEARKISKINVDENLAVRCAGCQSCLCKAVLFVEDPHVLYGDYLWISVCRGSFFAVLLGRRPYPCLLVVIGALACFHRSALLSYNPLPQAVSRV